ncbi:unnamed protein product [Boreogadus saida]
MMNVLLPAVHSGPHRSGGVSVYSRPGNNESMRPSDDGGSQRWSSTITESIQPDAEVILAPGWFEWMCDRRSPQAPYPELHPAFCTAASPQSRSHVYPQRNDGSNALP